MLDYCKIILTVPRESIVACELKQKMYDFVGTDLHHLERYRPMLDQLRLTRRQLEALEGLIANNARI